MVRDTVTAEMWLEELVVLVGFERLVSAFLEFSFIVSLFFSRYDGFLKFVLFL